MACAKLYGDFSCEVIGKRYLAGDVEKMIDCDVCTILYDGHTCCWYFNGWIPIFTRSRSYWSTSDSNKLIAARFLLFLGRVCDTLYDTGSDGHTTITSILEGGVYLDQMSNAEPGLG